MADPQEFKRCYRCRHTFPLEEGFHRDKHSADGHTYRCKKCAIAVVADWKKQEANKHRRQERDKQWIKAKRRAQRQEREQKVNLFIRQLERNGWNVVERRINVYDVTTTLVLERDGKTEKLDMRKAKI